MENFIFVISIIGATLLFLMVVGIMATCSHLKDIKEQISVMRKEIGLREKKKPKISKPINPYYDCSNCGMGVNKKDHYCKYCGQTIDWTEIE